MSGGVGARAPVPDLEDDGVDRAGGLFEDDNEQDVVVMEPVEIVAPAAEQPATATVEAANEGEEGQERRLSAPAVDAASPAESNAGGGPQAQVQQAQQAQQQPNIAFSVVLDDEDGTKFFEPSQPVRGRVVLVLQKPTIITAVKVQVLGLVSVGVGYSLLGASSLKMVQPIPLSTSISLFNDSISLFPPANETAATSLRLLPGRHTWPFSFRVPPVPTLPPTYRGRAGTVRYEAVATLERPSALARRLYPRVGHIPTSHPEPRSPGAITRRTVRVEMGVRSVESAEATDAYRAPNETSCDVVAGGLWWRKGSVKVKARIPRSAFCCDEKIPITFKIHNESTEPFAIEEVSLEERTTCTYADGSRRGPLTTARIPFRYAETFPPPPPFPPYNGEDPSLRLHTRTLRLSLPPLEPATPSVVAAAGQETKQRGLNASFTSSLLSVSHHLVVRCRSSAPGSAASTIEFPVHLVAIPRTRSLIHMLISVNGVNGAGVGPGAAG
ncbi:Arrestin domain-containing protein 2, partial [Irineochytrium annulatum]